MPDGPQEFDVCKAVLGAVVLGRIDVEESLQLARIILTLCVVALTTRTGMTQRRLPSRLDSPSHRNLTWKDGEGAAGNMPSVPRELPQNPLVQDLFKQHGLLPNQPPVELKLPSMDNNVNLMEVTQRLQKRYVELFDERRWAKGLMESWKGSQEWLGLRERPQMQAKSTHASDDAPPASHQNSTDVPTTGDGRITYDRKLVDQVNQAIQDFMSADDVNKVVDDASQAVSQSLVDQQSAAPNSLGKNGANRIESETLRSPDLPTPTIQLTTERLERLKQLVENSVSPSVLEQAAEVQTENASASSGNGNWLAKPTELSNQVLESLIDSLDRTTLDAMNNPGELSDTLEDHLGPAWRHGQAAMRRLNRAAFRARKKAERVSRDVAKHMPDSSVASLPNRSDFNSRNGSLAVVLAGFGLLAVALWIRKSQRAVASSSRPDQESIPRIRVADIRDRASVVQACDHWAYRQFGRQSSYWNHAQVFDAIARAYPGYSDEMIPLRDTYQFARYAPSQLTLSKGQLEEARRIIQKLDL